jgi:hypothetical protein
MLFVPTYDLRENGLGGLDLLPDLPAPVVLGMIQATAQFLQLLGRIPQNIVHPLQSSGDVFHPTFSTCLISRLFALAQALRCRVMDCLMEGVINTLRMVAFSFCFFFINPPNTHLISDESLKPSPLALLPSTQ